MEHPISAKRILAIASFGLALGLLAGAVWLMSAHAQCGLPGTPDCDERERRPTATDTKVALSTSNPTSTQFLCLEYLQWLKCIGNPQCNGLPRCPDTPTPSKTPVATATPTITPSPTPTVPTPTGTKLMCLECNEWLKCIANPQCNGLPKCPWSQCPLTTATATPPVKVDALPLGPISPLALGIGGAIAMLLSLIHI